MRLVEGLRLMVRGVSVLAGLVVSTTVSYAQSDTLTGAEIKRLTPGATIYINTPLNTKIPVHYGEDGSLTGSAGSMAFYLGSAEDTGQWRVVRNKLCHKWRRWFKGKLQCLTLRKRGNTVHWTSQNGRTGTARYHRPEQPPTQVATTQAQEKPKSGSGASPFQSALAQGQTVSGRTTKTKTTAVAAVTPTPSKSRTRAPQNETARRKVNSSNKAVSAPQKPPPVRTPSVAQRTSPNANTQKQVAGARQTAWQKVQSFRVARVDAFDMLNIRQGPSEYSSVVGRIPPTGRGVRIVGSCLQWWCPVVHDRVSGWVNRFYLSAER